MKEAPKLKLSERQSPLLLSVCPLSFLYIFGLPSYYFLIGLVVLLFILILISRSKSCCSCKQRAKHYPAKVRLIAYSKGMIYLEAQKDNPSKIDTPFHSLQYLPKTAEETAQEMIDERFCGVKRAKPRLLINYCYQDEQEGLAYLVYLFVVEVESPDLLYIDCKPSEGKWWDIKHFETDYSGQLLSPEMKEELACLKETVLLAQRLSKK